MLKRERLRRRWFISVEDRQQRLALGSLGKVHRAEVDYRVGIRYYEGMAWEHLLLPSVGGVELRFAQKHLLRDLGFLKEYITDR